MKVSNKDKGTVLADKASVAASLFKRTIGLLNCASLEKGEGLIICPCKSIHTFFMRFPIDALFVNKHNRIIKAIPSLRPWRLSSIYFNADFVIELPAGTLKSTSTSEGDTLSIV